jgi:hypothetical protein
MDIVAETAAREGHKKILGKRLMDGEDLLEVIKDDHAMIFDYKRIKMNVEAYRLDLQRKTQVCKTYTFYYPNVIKYDLSIKQKHLWYWSDGPNYGKTTNLKWHDERYLCSWYNYNEKFQTIHPDSQFLLLDEYSRPHLFATELNQMCDGTYQYPSKQSNAVRVEMILIICSNAPPHMLYPKAFPLIEARFNVV